MHNCKRRTHPKSNTRDNEEQRAIHPTLAYLKWHLLLLKLYGIIPFYTILSLYEIGPPTRRVTRITRLMLLAKAVMNIVHVYIYLSSTILKILFLRSQTDGITNMLDVTFCMICDITITWTCVCNTTIIMEIINRFLKVDRLLKQYADSPAERPTSTNIFNRYLFFIYAYIFSLIISYLKRTYDLVSLYFWIYILFYQLENAISCAFVVFISALMHLLAERFRYINQLIAQYNRREIVRSSEYYTHDRLMPASDFDGKTTNRNEATLQLFATNSAIIYGLYVDLLDILKMINNYAGLGLLAYLLYACYGLLSCAYNSLLFNWSPGEDLYYMVWNFSWLPLYASILTILANNCAKATEEANKTPLILARVYGKGKKYQTIIDKFLTKSLKQTVHFTAYHFFPINRATLFQIFSAVTTYLVILMQFKELEKSKDKWNAEASKYNYE